MYKLKLATLEFAFKNNLKTLKKLIEFEFMLPVIDTDVENWVGLHYILIYNTFRYDLYYSDFQTSYIYVRVCSDVLDFDERIICLTGILLSQGFRY